MPELKELTIDKIRIYIADDDEESREQVIEFVNNEPEWKVVGYSANYDDFLSDIVNLKSDIALISTNILYFLKGQDKERIFQELPFLSLIAYGEEESERNLKLSLHCGAREFITWDADKNMVKSQINTIFRISQQKKRESASPMPIENTSLNEGQIISVCSARAGTGKTFLATHLAAVISQFTKSKVVLVDFNFQFDDLRFLLANTKKEKIENINTLIPVANELNLDIVESVLWSHPLGFKVLFSGSQFQNGEMPSEKLTQILTNLTQYYNFIIVDTDPSILNETNLNSFFLSRHIILLTFPDILSLVNTKKVLEYFQQKKLVGKRLKIVVNRYDIPHSISIKDIENFLSLPVEGKLIEDNHALSLFVNRGLILTDYLDLTIMQGIKEIASLMMSLNIPKIKNKYNKRRLKWQDYGIL